MDAPLVEQQPSYFYVAFCFILVALVWGCTNPLLKRGEYSVAPLFVACCDEHICFFASRVIPAQLCDNKLNSIILHWDDHNFQEVKQQKLSQRAQVYGIHFLSSEGR